MLDSLYALLEKIGFTDPLHAPVTHFPIGLAVGAFLFLVVALIFGKKNLLSTARHVAILAFIFVFPTILFGVFDWLHYFKGALVMPIKIKMGLASATLVLLAIAVILGGELKVGPAPMVVVLALASVCVVGLGWFGGKLVYGGFSPSAEAPAATTPASGGGTAAPTPAGQRLYASNCASCHPKGGNVIETSLPVKTSKKLASLAEFTAFMRAPAMPDGSEGSMPPFPADQLSDARVKELYDYIVSAVPAWK